MPLQVVRRIGADKAQGLALTQVVPDPGSREIPLIREIQENFRKFSPKDVSVNQTFVEGYLGAKVLGEALRRAGPNPNPQETARHARSNQELRCRRRLHQLLPRQARRIAFRRHHHPQSRRQVAALASDVQRNNARQTSSSRRTAPLISSATLTERPIENQASRQPIVRSITAKVDTQGM